MAGQGEAMQGEAWILARRGAARLGWALQGEARQGF